MARSSLLAWTLIAALGAAAAAADWAPAYVRFELGLLASLGEIDARVLPPFGAVQALVRKNLGNATQWIAS